MFPSSSRFSFCSVLTPNTGRSSLVIIWFLNNKGCVRDKHIYTLQRHTDWSIDNNSCRIRCKVSMQGVRRFFCPVTASLFPLVLIPNTAVLREDEVKCQAQPQCLHLSNRQVFYLQSFTHFKPNTFTEINYMPSKQLKGIISHLTGSTLLCQLIWQQSGDAAWIMYIYTSKIIIDLYGWAGFCPPLHVCQKMWNQVRGSGGLDRRCQNFKRKLLNSHISAEVHRWIGTINVLRVFKWVELQGNNAVCIKQGLH